MMLPLTRLAVMRLTYPPGIGPRNLRAQQAPTRALLAFPLHGLAHGVAVVARIEEHKLCLLWKIGNLVQYGFLFGPAGGIDRGQQWPINAFSHSRNDHLEGVALNPTVVCAIAPSCVLISPTRHLAVVALANIPTWSLAGDQTLVARHALGIRPAFIDGLTALLPNRLLLQAMPAAIAVKEGAASGKRLVGQPPGKVSPMLAPP